MSFLFYSLYSSSGQAQEIKTHALGNALEALVITIDGEFEPGLADRFETLIRSGEASGYRIRLNSPGGSLIEGLRLGFLLRDNGYHTEVGRIEYSTNADGYTEGYLAPEETEGLCLSACALAFLGGEVRDEYSATKLGFHQFYGGAEEAAQSSLSRIDLHAEGLSQSQIMSGIIVSYMVEMGVDARVFAAASQAGPNDLTILTREEAIAFNVVTPGGFGSWFLEPYGGGIIAASKRLGPTRPYDQVHQVTVFCRKGDGGKLMLTADGGWDIKGDPTLTAYVDVISKPEADWQEFLLPAEAISVRIEGKTTWITFDLPIDVQTAMRSAARWQSGVRTGRSSGGYRAWHDMEDMDRNMINSSLTHCF